MAFGGFEFQMVVGIHEAVSVDNDAESLAEVGKSVEEVEPVLIVGEDEDAADAPAMIW
jgi:hypothetical protein